VWRGVGYTLIYLIGREERREGWGGEGGGVGDGDKMAGLIVLEDVTALKVF